MLHRLVPLARGLFEDHVANFWCVSSVLIKWKRLLPVPALARLALVVTVAAATPPMVHQILRPSKEGLLLALLNSSFAFFFFAFQGQGGQYSVLYVWPAQYTICMASMVSAS